MTTDDLIAEYTRVGGVAFPGSKQAQEGRPSLSIHQVNEGPVPTDWTAPFGSFFYRVRYHTDFDPEWPISIDWPAVIKGVRNSLHVSQAAFAQMCQIGRATVERWEKGTMLPFKGNAHQLLDLVRGHIVTPVQAGQVLNIAAAAVLPRLTRPTAEYKGREIANWLRSDRSDHSDLAYGLLGALTHARILIAIEGEDETLEDTYFPLAGRLHQPTEQPEWVARLLRDLGGLSPGDRRLVLAMTRRLAGSSVTTPGDVSTAIPR